MRFWIILSRFGRGIYIGGRFCYRYYSGNGCRFQGHIYHQFFLRKGYYLYREDIIWRKIVLSSYGKLRQEYCVLLVIGLRPFIYLPVCLFHQLIIIIIRIKKLSLTVYPYGRIRIKNSGPSSNQNSKNLIAKVTLSTVN